MCSNDLKRLLSRAQSRSIVSVKCDGIWNGLPEGPEPGGAGEEALPAGGGNAAHRSSSPRRAGNRSTRLMISFLMTRRNLKERPSKGGFEGRQQAFHGGLVFRQNFDNEVPAKETVQYE